MRPERRRVSGLAAAGLAAAVLLTTHATTSDASSDIGRRSATEVAAGPRPDGPDPDSTAGAVADTGTPPGTSTSEPPRTGTDIPAGPDTGIAARAGTDLASVTAAVDAVVPGTVSAFALLDRRSGRSHVEGAAEPLYTASVVKLLIALDVLREGGWVRPDGPAGASVARMLSASDDTIASRLWDRRGRTDVVTRMSAELGLVDTTAPDDDGEWELTRMSARDVVIVYRFVLDRLAAPERDFLMGALYSATPRGSDGFDQYFGIPDGLPGLDWAIKQGWMQTSDSLVLNTTGVVGEQGRYVLALLTAQPADTGYDTGRAAVTAGIAALAPSLAPTPA